LITLPELSFVLFSIIEKAINQWLSLDENANTRLAELNGKTIAIELTDLELKMVISIEENALKLLRHYHGEPDTSIKTDLATLFNMALNRGDTAIKGKMEISGEIDTGHKFKLILDEIEIDWEEQLSKLTGDVAAHQVGQILRSAKKWGQDRIRNMGLNLADYLVEEKRLVAHTHEVNEFIHNIDKLRDDTDRLAARIARFQNK